MKTRITFIAITLVLFAGSLQAQQKQQINNLATFAKVWGFLKYYHPEIAKGNPNWDEEWLKTALTITKVEGNKNFNRLLIRWYSNLPKAKLSDKITQIVSDSILRVFGENDIKRFNIPAGMRQQLLNLYLYHQPDSNKYISDVSGPYKLDYVWHNEEMFEKPSYPDAAHRLLALVRYWNIINCFYPHKFEYAPNWDGVLTDFIPQFMAAKNAREYQQAFLKLTAQIKDSHSFFKQKEWNEAQGFYTLPFRVYYVDGKYVIGKSQYDELMKEQDFRVGDEIIGVNGRTIQQRVKELTPYTTGTNALSFHRNIGQQLFRIDSKKTMDVRFKRGKDTFINEQVKLFHEGTDLYPYRVKHQQKHYEDLGNGVWYVRFCQIYDAMDLKQMFTAIKDAKAVIWEMRDYPNFKMVQAMRPGLFERREKTETDYNAMLFFPGAFKANNDAEAVQKDTLNLPLYKGKLIVLVDEFTQSLAESVTIELRNRPNTIVMGRQTAGATGNIVFTDFPGGIEASYTTVKVVGANDSFKQGQGVKIDIPIELTIKKMRSNADYELQQAYLEALKNN
jgi:carboxyl-terminal processing protease